MNVSEQVKELRTIANNLSIGHNMAIFDAVKQFRQAADTIESLSAKLDEANAERSERYYNGGWIYCGDGENLPEEPFGCIVTVIDTELMTMTDSEAVLPYQVGYSDGTWNDSDGKVIPFEVIAWMPAPKEPYHES